MAKLLEQKQPITDSPEIRAFSAGNSMALPIVETRECGLLVLRSAHLPSFRRVLYFNSYGGESLWRRVKAGEMPPQHLWGCIELVRRGYEVAIAEPLAHFNLRRRALPHDLKFIRTVREWLGSDGIIYSAHTLLYWLPLLRAIRLIRNPIVSLTYAREELDWARAHSGIIAMTPAAAAQAMKMAPRVKNVHLSWGADLGYFPSIAYSPQSFLSCGITRRDFHTLSVAAAKISLPVRVICPGLHEGPLWPSNVSIIDGGKGCNFQKKSVTYRELLGDYYAKCAALLVIIKEDAVEYTANGFTNVIEGMAMARPIIMTRTGAVPGEIDLEKHGCGIFVPPRDPEALAQAIQEIANDPGRAQAMGIAGRRLCEQHYNMERFGAELHRFFECL